MRLLKARITNYRSIKDSGWVEFETDKTIMVGPNEAGKSAFLRALQQINAPEEVKKIDALRDYPRKDYNDITSKRVDPAETDVAVAHFALEDAEKKQLARNSRGRLTFMVVGWIIPRGTISSVARRGQRLAIFRRTCGDWQLMLTAGKQKATRSLQ